MVEALLILLVVYIWTELPREEPTATWYTVTNLRTGRRYSRRIPPRSTL